MRNMQNLQKKIKTQRNQTIQTNSKIYLFLSLFTFIFISLLIKLSQIITQESVSIHIIIKQKKSIQKALMQAFLKLLIPPSLPGHEEEEQKQKLPSMNFLTTFHQSTPYNDAFIDRMRNVKRYKVSVVNQHIKKNQKMGNTGKIDRVHGNSGSQNFGVEQQKIGSNSMQIPLSMNKTFRQSNQNRQKHNKTTSSNFLNKSTQIQPKKLAPQNIHQSIALPSPLAMRPRQKSLFSHQSSTSKNSKLRQGIESETLFHLQSMKKLQQNLNQQALEKRLSTFSKESGKNSIRVYKDDIHKLIVQRFGKDRITTFLDTEYIEDFNSVLKTMKQLVMLKRQEMLVFCFLIIDQNRDGLITAQDLISLLGIKDKISPAHNPLILSDILKIHQHIQTQKSQGDPVVDSCSHPILKDQCLTFMKYRINNFRQKKHQATGQSQRKCFLSTRLHNHLYSLKEAEEEEGNQLQMKDRYQEGRNQMIVESLLMKILGGGFNRKQEKFQCRIGEGKKFAIGFDRFSHIYQYQMPKIFLDFLYLLGGLEMPGENYLKVDTSVLHEVVVEQKKQQQQIDMLAVTHRRLRQMTQFKKHLKLQKIKTLP